MRSCLALSAAILVAATTSVYPQSPRPGGAPAEQKVTPPEARYWMGATTSGGMLVMSGMMRGGQPSMADMMRMGAGGVPREGRSVELKLGTTLAPTGDPEAFHTMPPGAQVNKPIFLQTPQPGSHGSEPATPYKQPKGQISFYWGCGEKAGAGQPVVLSFDKLVRGENDPELTALEGSISARAVRKPSAPTSKTYGEWPHGDPKNRNRGLTASFPAGSSLAGPHAVEGTYTPKLGFTLGQNFMDGLQYTTTAVLPSGAIQIAWSGVNRATGYSLGVMAPEKAGDDSANIVMWSSANRPATFIQMEDLTPAEVKRLIGLKAVLPPDTTSCAVPAEVVKATREGSMLLFTAFGDEATFIHPPRPADPKTTWDQEWFARVSYKSVRMDGISPQGVQDLAGMMGGRSGAPPARVPTASSQPGGSGSPRSPDAAESDAEYCRKLEEARRAKPSPADVIGAATGRFGRLMGGKKKEEPPADPRCAAK